MTESVQLSDLAEADLVVLSTNLGKELQQVTDPDRIAALATFLAARQDGWYVPAGGPRVMKLRLNFSTGGVSRGSVGFGAKYLVAQSRGGFYQRDAEPGDRARLLELLELADPDNP